MYQTGNQRTLGTNIPHGVSSQNVDGNRRRGIAAEEKVAKALLKGIDGFSFDPAPFVRVILNSPVVLRRRFLSLVVILIRLWAQKMDDNLWEDDTELNFLVEAKRIQDALLPFYPNGFE